MEYWTDKVLRSLSLFLCEQTNEVGRAVGGDLLAQQAKLYRSCVRYALRWAFAGSRETN
jgi:hypothetical protein